jgi:hypothetical protein
MYWYMFHEGGRLRPFTPHENDIHLHPHHTRISSPETPPLRRAGAQPAAARRPGVMIQSFEDFRRPSAHQVTLHPRPSDVRPPARPFGEVPSKHALPFVQWAANHRRRRSQARSQYLWVHHASLMHMHGARGGGTQANVPRELQTGRLAHALDGDDGLHRGGPPAASAFGAKKSGAAPVREYVVALGQACPSCAVAAHDGRTQKKTSKLTGENGPGDP